MTRAYSIFLMIIFVVNFISAQRGDRGIENLNPGELIEFDFSAMEKEDILKGIDLAAHLIQSKDSVQMERGTILLAGMAYALKAKIDKKEVNPKTKAWAEVLDRFKVHGYYVHQPRVHRFIKLSTYLCQGNYAHVLKRYRENSIFFPSIVVLMAIIIFYLKSLFKKNRSKGQWVFIRLCHVGLMVLLILWIGFKFSCETGVSQYSFYGIPF